ncbi:MAG TPA: molecular chaperone TorD family protein [Burkholderiales bacterium]|jgi:TorA maturation chaperone TorD
MNDGGESQAGEALSEEDAARANLYALIGRLFHEAPDSILLAQLCGAPGDPNGENVPLGQAWKALQDACTRAYPIVVKQEYDNLFVGVGKAEISPYTSRYVRGISPDRHLVRLRERLEQLGLARRNAAFEVEDHVSGVCDVMRFLIVANHSLSDQRLFFNEFVYQGASSFCDLVSGASSAVFYRYVAAFARAFLEVERRAFEMLESDG